MKDELRVLSMIAGFAVLGLIWAWIKASADGHVIQFGDSLPALAFGIVIGIGVVTPFLVFQNRLSTEVGKQ